LALGYRALREGLIDPPTLLAAFEAWEREPAASLVELLRDRAGLTETDLERLAGGPPPRDLAASSETVAYTGPPLGQAVGPAPAPPSPAARYRTIGLHDSGGLGMIYDAIDLELDRRVALKELQPRHAHDEMSQLRFVQEALITGRLEHPAIVPIYGLGRHPDGRPYYAMRFIEGETFRAAVDRFHRGEKSGPSEGRELQFRRLLRSVVEVCFALAYAHSRGVVHRDVKPENIMLGRFGETLLVDWGIAKTIGPPGREPDPLPLFRDPAPEDLPYMTRPGSAVGTPQYMSPEQAEGELEQTGPASDVYGIGATLYYLLVGRPPFVGEDVEAMLQQVRRGIFPAPRSVRKSVDAELEAICLRAMAARPADRFASALEMADAIEAWLARVRYRDEQQEAMEQVRESRCRLALERASTCFNRGRDGEGMLWLARALESGASGRERGIRLSLAAWHRRDRSLERTAPQAGEVAMLRFSPDGRRLASAAADGLVRIWDVSRGTPLGTPMAHPGPIAAMAFSRDGRRLVTGCADGVVRRWDGLSGDLLGESTPLGGPCFLHPTADGSLAAVATGTGSFEVIDAETGGSLAVGPAPAGFGGGRGGLACGGDVIALADEAGEVRSWSLRSHRWGDRPLRHPAGLTAMAVHPGGGRIATCCRDGMIRLWEPGAGSPAIEHPYHDEIAWAGFSPDGATLVLISKFGEVRLRSANDGVPLGEPFTHDAKEVAPAFHPDGSLIAARGRDGFARLWDAASGLAVGPPLDQGGRALGFAFSPDGRRLATAGSDGSIRIWKAPSPAVGEVERIGCWVRIQTNLDVDAGDAVRPLDSLAGWEMRRRLQELGGPPVK